MFTKASGITSEDAKLIAEYLNATSDSPTEYGWSADLVGEDDSVSLGIDSQEPIVLHGAPTTSFRRGISKEEKQQNQEDLEELMDFFENEFQGQYYYQKEQSNFYITDVDLLEQLKEEARDWKYGASKASFFGNSEANAAKKLKEIDINQLMTDIAMEMTRVMEYKGKKAVKSELSANDFTHIVSILTKIQSGQEQEITSSERNELNEFKQKLAKSGVDSRIIDRLNLIDSNLPKMEPRGGLSL